jgi:hypothetical protein
MEDRIIRILHANVRMDMYIEKTTSDEVYQNVAKSLFLFFGEDGKFRDEEYAAAKKVAPLDAIIRLKHVLILRMRVFLRSCHDESRLLCIAIKYNEWLLFFLLYSMMYDNQNSTST